MFARQRPLDMQASELSARVRPPGAIAFWLIADWLRYFLRRRAMGERGSKKDKNKLIKQKQQQAEKKKQQQNAKLPVKKTA
jgi:hypothetical protein